jgi:hypothetical protein
MTTRKTFKSYSASVLALSGVILVAMGAYFAFLRPPLLPEDLRFLATSSEALERAIPNLPAWLHMVFRVMGGQMVAAGLLTVYLAVTAFRVRARGAAAIALFAGLTSIGLMAVVNFAIASDFKWPLLGFALTWALALALYWRERPEGTSHVRA